jgi:hypothetical protein
VDKAQVSLLPVILVACLCVAPVRAEDRADGPRQAGSGDALFYRALPYGSQASFNPFFILVNGSFDMVQTGHVENRVAAIRYAEGFRNVNRNLLHPLDNISRYGWSEFFGNELMISDPNVEHSQWVPNYTLHMIGGGLTYRALSEWYRHKGFARPELMAGVNCLAYHYVNEAVENGASRGPNVDAIADFLLFNPLGIALFSNDHVAGFFSRELNAANWSSQPVLNLRTGRLDNMALSFAFKYFPLKERPVGLFYYTGMNTALGATWRFHRDYSISGGAGVGTVGIYKVEQANGERKLTAALGRTAGLFWDKGNSLLQKAVTAEGTAISETDVAASVPTKTTKHAEAPVPSEGNA